MSRLDYGDLASKYDDATPEDLYGPPTPPLTRTVHRDTTHRPTAVNKDQR